MRRDRIIAATTIIFTIGCAMLAVPSCGRAPDPWGGTTKPRILTSIAPLHSFAANVAEPDAEVLCLLTSSTGPHEFQPTPNDARLLSTADLFVVNGLGLEEFIEPMIKSSGNRKVKIVRAGEHIPKERIIDSEGHYHGTVFHAGGSDPHVWLGIEEAKIQVQAIRDALIEIDPSHKAGYSDRAGKYLAQLDALKKSGEELKKTSIGLITSHDAFRYFARSFDLTIAGVIRGTHGEDSGSAELTRLRKLINDFLGKGNVVLIGVEPQYPRGVAENLAKDSGSGKVKIVELDPLETGNGSREHHIDKDFYTRKMAENIDHLKQALK